MLAKIKVLGLLITLCTFCSQPQEVAKSEIIAPKKEALTLAANRPDLYLPQLNNKNIALVVNQTSVTESGHLVDYLLTKNIKIKKIFAPEHGFRGKADAGEKVKDGRDVKTNLPIISLYGKNKKPSQAQLAGVEIVVFDIQDVGARFYTYISTMHYVMEACAEKGIPVMILDRPNPNGHYVDGPVLNPAYRSFVGMHQVPIVHGMTVGEYAQMINGEGWLEDGLKCELIVIPCAHYRHDDFYELPIKPSPNLPNSRSICLYPSLCFFEGTTISIGRGTARQFQLIGHPDFPHGTCNYTPISRAGAKYPKHQDKQCRGYDLTSISVADLRAEARLNLDYLIDFYKDFPDKENFFLENNFIDKLAGDKQLRMQIIAGKSADEIRASWMPDLEKYKLMRKQYLMYP